VEVCCQDLLENINKDCSQHNRWNCADSLLIYDEVEKRYGLSIKDGGQSYIAIKYCPFCGKDTSLKSEDNGHRFLFFFLED